MPKLDDTDLIGVVDETIEYFQRRLPHLGGRVQLRREGDVTDAACVFNRDLLGWVLENLIKNGIDALTDGKGTITVTLEDHADGGVALRVSDTGKGIPARDGNKIFEPGFTTKKRGWGMGLALVKRIVTQYHGGRIRIESTGPHGTTFLVTLPPAGDSAGFLKQRSLPWLSHSLGRRQHRGTAVPRGVPGREGLRGRGRDQRAATPWPCCAEKNFDAILLDEMMPGMGGLETLEEIRKINAHIPVIMITKSEAEDLMTRAIGKRIDDYLVKPVSPLQILSALKRQLEARKLTGEEVTRDYMSNFMPLGDRFAAAAAPADWEGIYTDLVTWGMDLFQYSDHGLLETLEEQITAANLAFAKYVREHYRDWVNADGATGVGDRGRPTVRCPLLSPRVFETWVEPEIQQAASRSSGSSSTACAWTSCA